jgi:Replication protein
MLRVRELPPELMYRNRSPKRSPRMSSRDPAKRSLVNCNHQALTDQKNDLREETLAERLERKTKHIKRRAAQKYMYKQLLETIRGIGLSVAYREVPDEVEPKGKKTRTWSAARDFRRLDACQTLWRAFKPKCCDGRSVAIPIGCNHRLCPLCNAARLEHYRGPMREIVSAMENPTFLTLTVPNVDELTRRHFEQMRGWWKEFYRRNKSFLRGGLYSIEVTYNRQEKTWHVHLHIVYDSVYRVSGMKRAQFNLLVAYLQFAWVRITSSKARKAYKAGEIERWMKDRDAHSAGDSWFSDYWRKVDIRRVKGENAVYEVIKYISKTNRFLDLPEAVAPYLRAIRNVRAIQTFGSFYNIKLEVPLTAKDVEALAAAGIQAEVTSAKSFLHCDCGKNHFEDVGFVSMESVEQDENGRWCLKPSCVRKQCRGWFNLKRRI